MRPRSLLSAVVALAVMLGTLVVTAPSARAQIDDRTPANGWRPSGGTAYALARAGDMVIIGGTFTSMVSATGTTAARNRLAAVSASTGELLPWAPNPNGEVRALAASGDGQTVYVGGTFTTIGGLTRSNLAAVSATTGRATAFSADTNATVRALLFTQDRLFVGGTFWRVRNIDRGGGAQLDPATGALMPWNPRTNYGTYSLDLAADGSGGIFIGGPFTTVSGAPRSFVAKVDSRDGILLPWTSGSTCQDAQNACVVYSLRSDGSDLFLGVGGPGGRVTSLDATTGRQKWWTGGDGDVQVVVVDGTKVYGGGHFAATMNNQPRAGLVALDRYTGAVLSELDAQVLGGTGVWSILKDGNRLRFAGQHSTIDGAAIGRYSSFPISADPADTTAPTTPSALRSPAPLADGVTLAWTASSDNVATVSYQVTRNGTPVGTTPIPTFKDFGVAPATTYSYGVAAVDAAGNVSPVRTLSVTTEAATPTLLRRQATWAYHSRGTLPAANWQAVGYDDTSWSRGVGEFGFGEGDEQTYISPLGVAHYFRTTFNVPSGTTIQSARLRAVIDDGAVFYVNGTEVARPNMPAGAVDQNTLASSGIGGDTEMTYQSVSVPVSALRTGTNVLAVEVHNNSASSSDISFDAFVPYVGTDAPSAPPAPSGLTGTASSTSVALSWTASSGATSYVVERDGTVVGRPTGATFTDSGLTPGTEYVYTVAGVNSAGTGPASGSVAVTTTSGNPSVPPAPTGLAGVPGPGSAVLTWNASPGADGYVLTRDGVEVSRPTATSFTDENLTPGTTYEYRVAARNDSGTGSSSEPVTVTPTATGPAATYALSGDTWRYLDNGSDPGSTWRQPSHDDGGWKAGPTEAGYGDGDERTTLTWGNDPFRKPLTVYARRTFDAGASVSDVTELAVRLRVDDGAVVYLNGSELTRFNLPTGPVTSTTRATRAIAGSEESLWRAYRLPATALTRGTNTLAVEIHNDSGSSSDLSFDLEVSPVR